MRNAGNLTIGKLVNIVLAGLLLVLILYGVAHGGLNPLIKKVGMEFDNTLAMLHIKTGNTQDCYSENIRNLGGGDSFLKEIGAGTEGAVFSVCRNAVCNISVDGVGNYKKSGGNFYQYHDGKWRNGEMLVITPFSYLQDIKFYWDLYNIGGEMIGKKPLKEIYDKGYTKQLILYGDGAGLWDKPTKAIWQNDIWRVSVDGGRFYTFTDDDKAIREFVKGVDDYFADSIYLKEVLVKPGEHTLPNNNNHGKLILTKTRLVNTPLSGLNKDTSNLESLFSVEKKKLLEEAAPSKDDIKKMKETLDGTKVNIDGKSFTVSVEETKNFPIITFSDGKNKYGLKHAGQLNDIGIYQTYLYNGKVGEPKLKTYSIYITKWENGKWDDNNIEIFSNLYRMPNNYFKRDYVSTLIKNFLDEKCK